MAHDRTQSSGALTGEDAKQSYIVGIQSAHALERQATQLINRQLERIDTYPEVALVIRQHGVETKRQIERLEGILRELGSGPSTVKDLALEMTGNAAAVMHSMMSDEIMKNHFANVAFEAFEQAAYRSLVAMAQATGHPHHVAIYEQSLREEEKTFQTLLGMTDELTRKFMELSLSGGRAKT